jgi:hypothetical protein
MTAAVEYLRIAWPGLLVLAGFVALIVHAARDYRRKHPRGRWRIRFDGPLGVVTAEHELTEEQAGRFAILAQHLVGQERLRGGPRPTHREPLARRWVRDYDQEQAWATSAHSRGLHRGEHADPNCFHCALRDGKPWAFWRQGDHDGPEPVRPDPGQVEGDSYTDDAGMYRSRRYPGRAG